MTKNGYRFVRCVQAVQEVAKERFPFALTVDQNSYKEFYSFVDHDDFIDDVEGPGGSSTRLNQYSAIMGYTLEILNDMDFIKFEEGRVLFYPEILELNPFELVGNDDDDDK